jgi:hypothetical protein
MYEEPTYDNQRVWNGMPLPLMPSQPILRAAYQYQPNSRFALCTHPHTPAKNDVVVITVQKPIKIGYGCVSQVVLATVESGRDELVGKTVIVKFFDPLYLIPENLSFVRLVG